MVGSWLLAFAGLLSIGFFEGHGADWVRPGRDSPGTVWGLKGGLQWAIPPGGFPPPGGPRGLIRLGYPIATNGDYRLVNFIAIEPVVNGVRGFSELERSRLDEVPGKRIWALPADDMATDKTGPITQVGDNAEQLEVTLQVERFENGADVRVTLAQRSDAPDEVRFTVHTNAGSSTVEYVILTATMGNLARTRLLWLQGGSVTSLKLYPDYRADGFAPHRIYPLSRLDRDGEGDVLVAITSDEAAPAAVFPFPGRRSWHYDGEPVTQFWKKRRETVRDDLHAAVNARYTYWMSRQPIPGGVAFENFELRERFHPGQEFVFGITKKTPEELLRRAHLPTRKTEPKGN